MNRGLFDKDDRFKHSWTYDDIFFAKFHTLNHLYRDHASRIHDYFNSHYFKDIVFNNVITKDNSIED